MPQRYEIVNPETGKPIAVLTAPDDATQEQVDEIASGEILNYQRGQPFSKSAAVIRGLGGFMGMFGQVPGAIGGGTSELFAEGVEKAQGIRESYSWPQIGTQTIIGALPGIPAGTGGPVAQVLRQTGGSALLGAGGEAATELAEGRMPKLGNVLTAGGIAGGLGLGLGLRGAQIRRRVERMRLAQEGQGPAAVLDPVSGDLVPVAPGAPGPTPPTPRGRPSPGGIPDETLISQELLLGPEPEVGATPESIMDPQVKLGHTESMVDTAKDDIEKATRALAATEASAEGRRLFLQLADAFDNGTIAAQDVLQVIEKEGMSLPQFLQHWKDTISTAGMQLNRLSQLRRELNLFARRNPDVAKALGGAGAVKDPVTGNFMFFSEDPDPWTVAYDYMRRFDDFTRASIVTQLATTMRNVESQVGRYSLDAMDVAFQKVILGESIGSGANEMVRYFQSAFRAMNPKQIQEMAGILDNFPIEAQRLIQLPAGEVSLGSKYTRFINTANRMQEHFFRRAAFDAYLRRTLEESGADVQKMLANPKKIPEQLVQDAVNHALEITFVAPPQGTPGRWAMQAWTSLRPFALSSSLIFPFPRFMINAYKFLTDFSPAAIFKLMGYHPEVLMADPKRYAQVASRMQLGTLMLGGALAIRNSEEMRGPKWYQMRLMPGGPIRDMRALAPFGTFLFYAEAIRQQAEKGRIDMTNQDWVQGLLSINRLAGTGLVALDVLRGMSAEQFKRFFGDTVAQFVGRVTVPGRQFRDILSEFSEDEGIARSTREPVNVGLPPFLEGGSALLAPGIANLPVISRVLPPLSSPMRANPRRALNPLARQFGAPTQVDLNPVENAVAELGIEFRQIGHGTGIRKFDRLADEIMGKIVAGPFELRVGNRKITGFELVESPAFKEADALLRKLELTDFLSKARGLSTKVALKKYPEFIPELWFKRQKPTVRQILEETPGIEEMLQAMRVHGMIGGPRQ